MFEHKTFLHSLKWAYLGAIGDKTFSTLFYLVLAGMLGPRDFGIVSLAMIYVSFLTMFLDQGLATALIQKKDLKQEHLDAVFWMNLGLSVCLVVVSLFFSRTWGGLNHSSELAFVTSVLSVGIIFEALTVVQIAILKRELNFRNLSIRANVSNSVSLVFGVVLAWMNAGLWALVGQSLLRDLIALTLLWKLAAWRPSLSFSWARCKELSVHLKELLGFSVNNFAAQLALYTDMQAGSIAIGMFFGPAEVGLYRIADKVMSTVITVAMSSIHTVSLPQFSRLQDNPRELKKSVLACIRLSSAVTLPALAGLAAVSHPLMAVIGLKWVPAANALGILCIMGMCAVFTYFTGPLMQALGRTRQIAFLTWARTLIGCFFLVGAGWLARNSPPDTQVVSIAGARLAITAAFDVPFYVYYLLKLAKISLSEFANAAVPSIVASSSVAVSVHFFGESGWLEGLHPLPLLAVQVLPGGLIGIGTLLLIDWRLRDFAAGVIKRLMRG